MLLLVRALSFPLTLSDTFSNLSLNSLGRFFFVVPYVSWLYPTAVSRFMYHLHAGLWYALYLFSTVRDITESNDASWGGVGRGGASLVHAGGAGREVLWDSLTRQVLGSALVQCTPLFYSLKCCQLGGATGRAMERVGMFWWGIGGVLSRADASH